MVFCFFVHKKLCQTFLLLMMGVFFFRGFEIFGGQSCGPWMIFEFAGVTLTLRCTASFADDPGDCSMVSR